MELGSSDFTAQAARAGKTAPFYLETGGDGTVTGDVTIKGTFDVTGSAAFLQSVTVGKPQPAGATLDVDGTGHFVDPGLDDPGNGGIKVTRAGAAAVDLGIQEGANPGEYTATLQASLNATELAINPSFGIPVIIGSAGAAADLTVNGNITSTGDIEATGLIASNESIGAVASVGVAYVIGNATGDLKLNGDLDIYPAGQSTATPSLHHLDSTPNSTNNYFTAGGGKVGFGGITTPGQQIDVSGNIQASSAILSGTFMKAYQSGPLAAYSVGLFGGGDTIIPDGTNVSPFISVVGLTDSMNLGARIMLTYKRPTGAFPIGPADCGGGALTAVPAAGGFTIYSQNNVTVPLPGLPGATVSWLIADLG